MITKFVLTIFLLFCTNNKVETPAPVVVLSAQTEKTQVVNNPNPTAKKISKRGKVTEQQKIGVIFLSPYQIDSMMRLGILFEQENKTNVPATLTAK